MYFLQGQHLAPASVTLPRTAVRFRSVISLLHGPSPAQRAAGLTSDIPAKAVVYGISIGHGVASLDVSPSFLRAATPEALYLAVAQLTYTLTQLPGVAGLRLLVHGQPVASVADVPLDRVLMRSDFSRALPPLLLVSPSIGSRIAQPLVVQGYASISGLLQLQLLSRSRRTIATDTFTVSRGEEFALTIPFIQSGTPPDQLRIFVALKAGNTAQLADITLP
ncbi:MAG: GerMN domain-containing protein [Acidimicrobiales bacterium]